MKIHRMAAGAFLLYLVLGLSNQSLACPLCGEAIQAPTGHEVVDPLREARAYNQAIYLMVGMPYLLLGFVGFMIYRKLRTSAAASAPVAAPQNSTSVATIQEKPSCSPLPAASS